MGGRKGRGEGESGRAGERGEGEREGESERERGGGGRKGRGEGERGGRENGKGRGRESGMGMGCYTATINYHWLGMSMNTRELYTCSNTHSPLYVLAMC